MRSKAQDFRQQEWLSKHNRPPQTRKRSADGESAGAASRRKQQRSEVGLQNETKGIQPGPVLEEHKGKPSRKSTRKSADHIKRTSNLQNKAMMAARSPKARHARAAAKRR